MEHVSAELKQSNTKNTCLLGTYNLDSRAMKQPNLSKFLFLTCVVYFAVYLSVASAQGCTFVYWELVPQDSNCKIFELPDFDLERIESAPDNSKRHKQFCRDFKVTTPSSTQSVSYCYTGRGDRFGPEFRLGDSSWTRQSAATDNVFFFDLGFSGCYKGKATKGMVFGESSWKRAPQFIMRTSSREQAELDCKTTE
ncbi:MAG: hypothetical protein KDD62_13220 [Bdellovibrionales bacterium]|nr:hypothetical protein [Bdellovibrionales bacterium]